MQSNCLIKNSKILITGGAGFIGSNIVESLLDQDNYVVCLDNFSTGKPQNVKSFTNNPSFKLIDGDIRSIDDCHLACENIDYVLHQAALGSVPRSIDNPKDSTDVNIGGFVNMLIAARDARVKRFVYAASSSVYGDSTDLPKLENVLGKPLSPYAITKYVNELYASMFNDLYGLETIGLRYFNVFGPRQDSKGAYVAVIPEFIISLLNGVAPTINGDGENSRDFTYIENVIQANQLAALTENKNAINQVFNVACGKKMSLNELFSIILKIVKKYKPEVQITDAKHGAERAGDIQHSLASIDKIQKELCYKPIIDAEIGLQKTIEWFVKKY